MKNIAFLVLSLMGGMLVAKPVVASSQPMELVRGQDGQETLTIYQKGLNGYKLFTLGDPHRLVIDMQRRDAPPQLSLPRNYEGGLITAARSGRFDPETVRYVFELKSGISIASHRYDGREGRLTVRFSAAGAAISAAQASAAAGAAKPAEQKDKPSAPAARKKKPVVVIDPGHGGQDPGAIGPRGTREKDIVLEYARALQNRLIKTGKFKVVLTREGDKFIPLRERVAIARAAGGDIFLSLHADSAPNDEARGLSVYTVSETASDKEAEALAARENKADVIAGIDLSGEREDVAGILISLAQRETKNNSATLADTLVSALNDKVRLLQNTHRFAGFAVLKAPDIPSVLVEIGFLSHRDEEKLLRTRSYREKVVAGLAEGIEEYFKRQTAVLP